MDLFVVLGRAGELPAVRLGQLLLLGVPLLLAVGQVDADTLQQQQHVDGF